MATKFRITYIKDGKAKEHSYTPDTKAEALGVGNELCRDYVADYFRVDRIVVSDFYGSRQQQPERKQ